MKISLRNKDISALKPAKYHVLISTVMVIPQKGRPINFCVNFSGGVNPRNPPLNTGLLIPHLLVK